MGRISSLISKSVVREDWEEKLSSFLQRAIEEPYEEPYICEELIRYVMLLVGEEKRKVCEKMINILEEDLSCE
jgi:hypothetical protein